jgi:tetratricopeptide (TPR) repeat protein
MSRQSCFHLLSCLLLGLAVAMAATGSGFGQGYTAPEYDEYQRAVEGGPDTLLEWYKSHPDSMLREYAVPKFIEWVRTDAGEGKFQEAVATGEKFLAEIDSSHFGMLNLTTYSAYNSGQWGKATRYAEKVYQAKPETPEILKILSNSYLRLSDIPRTVEYGEKFCAEASPGDCFAFYPVIAGYYAERKQWPQADSYARKVLGTLETVKQPQGVSEDQWSAYTAKSRADANSIIGKAAFERKAWTSAQGAYQKLLRLSSGDSGRKAEAYFYIGMTHWRLEEFTPAMVAFAKGAQLNGGNMVKLCDEQLQVLYRATHNGSLAGLDVFLEEHPPD